jgi:hypothetical protein
MVGLVTPYSYDYFPNLEDGMSLKEFTSRLLSDYLKEYRRDTNANRWCSQTNI